MSITLANARTRILKLADDVDGVVADSTTVQDDALLNAFHAVYLQASALAPDRFAKEASVTTNANGVADLSSLDPVRILSVSHVSGVTRLPIPPCRLSDGPSDVAGEKTLKISYLPALTFPASSGDAFVWGQSSLDLPALDALMCLRAASELTALQDQANLSLERLITRAERDASLIANFSTWSVMPMRSRSRDSGLCYAMTDATSLQIVRL